MFLDTSCGVEDASKTGEKDIDGQADRWTDDFTSTWMRGYTDTCLHGLLGDGWMRDQTFSRCGLAAQLTSSS